MRLRWVVGDRFRVSARVEGVGKWGCGAEVWAVAMATLFRRSRWPGWLTGGSGRWSRKGLSVPGWLVRVEASSDRELGVEVLRREQGSAAALL